TFTFTMDLTTPTAGVTLPAAGSAAASPLTMISGTAQIGASGLANVQVSVRRLSDKLWWNFFSGVWVSSTVQVSTTLAGTSPWVFLPDQKLQGNLLVGTSYFIAAAGTSNAFPSNTGNFFAQGSTF